MTLTNETGKDIGKPEIKCDSQSSYNKEELTQKLSLVKK